jgi:hypothetical protein
MNCNFCQETWSRPSISKQRPSDSSFTLTLKTDDIYKQDSQGSTLCIENFDLIVHMLVSLTTNLAITHMPSLEYIATLFVFVYLAGITTWNSHTPRVDC